MLHGGQKGVERKAIKDGKDANEVRGSAEGVSALQSGRSASQGVQACFKVNWVLGAGCLGSWIPRVVGAGQSRFTPPSPGPFLLIAARPGSIVGILLENMKEKRKLYAY